MTRRNCFFLGLLVSWVWGVCAFATEENEEQLLNLLALIQEAAENNPEIGAARQRWEAAKAVIPQVQTLPDPRLNFGYKDILEREAMYGFSQEIPFPGKLRLRGEIAAREAERAEQEYLATRLRVIARLKEAYYDLCFVYKSIDIISKNKLLLVDFESTAKARYAVGRAVQQDVFRAQTEISRVFARLAILEQRRESVQAEINRLVNRPPTDPLGRPQEVHQVTPLTHSLAELTAMLGHASPLLRAQVKGVERGDRAVALAKREYFPDFGVDTFGFRNETMRENGYQVMFGIKIPLYYASKQREGVREAFASREAAAQELQAVRQELLFRLKDNVALVQRAARLITILRDAIIQQATLTLESAQAGYAVGTVDFLTLLNSLLTLQENELELHEQIVEHEKAVARIEEIIGSTP
ncbi:MAG: TolC family protein [Bacillota bacterium]|jgi:outer membrane protein TolC